MYKGGLVFVVIASTVVLWFKRREARAHLRAVERGSRCLACESSEVEPVGTSVRCDACGYVASAELLGESVSEAELAELTKPAPGRRW